MTSFLMGLALTAGPAVPAQIPMAMPANPLPAPGFAPPPAPPVFAPPPVLVPNLVPTAMTLDQFARCFVPTPGAHRVYLIHPRTCQAVEVCFTLPACACPPTVRTGRRSVEFDYGRKSVEIIARLGGRIDVKY